MKLLSHYISFLLVYLCLLLPDMYGQGLGFRGNDYPIDKRTSYDVFNKGAPKFDEKLNISFYVSIVKPSRLGYIVRIKNNEYKTTYNLSYFNDGDFIRFKFNEEGKSTLIAADIDSKELPLLQWFRISINFDLHKKSLQLSINDHLFEAKGLKLEPHWEPGIYFGKSEHMIDVPSFSIKQLAISDTKQLYEFPLKENNGEEVHSSTGNLFGKVSNPIWLINQSYYWSYKTMFRSTSIATYSYNPVNENIYILNKDSITTYNLRSGDIRSEAFGEKCPVDIFIGSSFLDVDTDKLYVYEAHVEDSHKPVVASFDLVRKKWSIESYDNLPMYLHHHSVGQDKGRKRYYIFGGFGNVYYSKGLYSFDYNVNKWNVLHLKGDTISPRYFSSMGYRNDNNSLYIFGGMGNESGEQIVGRQYFYDLHRVDLNDNTVSKIWDIPWDKENMVPVREMVIQNDSSFYTLCYPEHFSNSFLKLFRFSLEHGTYQILGDSIPIRSEKIKTKANLYYSSKLNSLYAIVQEFDDDDISSNVKIYSLAFPPVGEKELGIYNSDNEYFLSSTSFLLLLLCSVVVGIPIIVCVLKRRKAIAVNNIPSSVVNVSYMPQNGEEIKPSSIYLFGEFMVRDRLNRDITYMFSAKLKQTFLLILQYSPEGGISSQHLSELLWPDKSEDKVKNSRGVTMNLLRKIIKELDGITLIYEKGLFRVDCNNLCYCDYLHCLDILSLTEIDENYRSELIEIIARGKFLKFMYLPEFDLFKENLEQKIEPILLIEAEKSFREDAYKITIALCDAIFDIDPINDRALSYIIHSFTKLKMDSEAKKHYLSFCLEYKRMIGAEYPVSFTDVLDNRIQ